MQESALKRPTAPSAESPTLLKSKRSAQGELAQMLNARPRVVAQRALAAQLNRGGMPEGLRSGIESLSGVSMAGVKVHYNSAKPAQLNAEAYAQGRDIHLAPGKSHHLPHEAWDVAQQAQGRVKPTMQLKKPTPAPAIESVPINDDKRLEKEADTMGKKAATLGGVTVQRAVPKNSHPPKPVADTHNMYTADSSGKYVVYSRTVYNRKDMGDFSGAFRNYVLKQYAHTEDSDGDVDTVRVATGTHENAKGVVLDHIIPWKDIAKNMDERNDAARWTKPYIFAKYSPGINNGIDIAADKNLYSLYDARSYYHDVDNLRPLLHSDNSAAGATGEVSEVPAYDHNVAIAMAGASQSFYQFQSLVNRQDKNKISSNSLVANVTSLENSISTQATALQSSAIPATPYLSAGGATKISAGGATKKVVTKGNNSKKIKKVPMKIVKLDVKKKNAPKKLSQSKKKAKKQAKN